MGFIGLHEPIKTLPFSPCVEIGWRLAKQFWHKGYATEAAREALNFAFQHLQFLKLYSFTTVDNVRSRAVMERLNMVNTNENFAHPLVPLDHTLREHVLYVLSKEQWNKYN